MQLNPSLHYETTSLSKTFMALAVSSICCLAMNYEKYLQVYTYSAILQIIGHSKARADTTLRLHFINLLVSCNYNIVTYCPYLVEVDHHYIRIFFLVILFQLSKIMMNST